MNIGIIKLRISSKLVHEQFGELSPTVELTVMEHDDFAKVVEVFKNRIAIDARASKSEPFWKFWLNSAHLHLHEVRDPITFQSYQSFQDVPRVTNGLFLVEGFVCDHEH